MQFKERSKHSSVAMFPGLNRETLMLVASAILGKVNGQLDRSAQDQDLELTKILKEPSFAKLYAHFLSKMKSMNLSEASVYGQWVKYEKGSDPVLMVAALAGMNTGRCNAGIATASSHLSQGDFHMFLSKNEHGVSRIPRLGMRMQDSEIVEVREVGKDQNQDPFISGANTLELKFKEFEPKAEKYKKKVSDMKKLTAIAEKHKDGLELDADDLRFLYKIDGKIQGFVYKADPRVKEILKGRNTRQDIVKASRGTIQAHEISFTTEEALRGGMKFHVGDLDLYAYKSLDGIHAPDHIQGNLLLNGLTSQLKGWCFRKPFMA